MDPKILESLLLGPPKGTPNFGKPPLSRHPMGMINLGIVCCADGFQIPEVKVFADVKLTFRMRAPDMLWFLGLMGLRLVQDCLHQQ